MASQIREWYENREQKKGTLPPLTLVDHDDGGPLPMRYKVSADKRVRQAYVRDIKGRVRIEHNYTVVLGGSKKSVIWSKLSSG